MGAASGLTPCASHGHGDRPAEGRGHGGAPGEGRNRAPVPRHALSCLERFVVDSAQGTQAVPLGAESLLEDSGFLSRSPRPALKIRFSCEFFPEPALRRVRKSDQPGPGGARAPSVLREALLHLGAGPRCLPSSGDLGFLNGRRPPFRWLCGTALTPQLKGAKVECSGPSAAGRPGAPGQGGKDSRVHRARSQLPRDAPGPPRLFSLALTPWAAPPAPTSPSSPSRPTPCHEATRPTRPGL